MRLSGSLLLIAVTLAAQVDSRQETTDYLVRLARAITDRAAGEIGSVESWEKVRARRLEEMRDMLGLLPWPPRTPLHVQKTGVLDRGDYFVEKIAFESMPKIYVTANLYLPKQQPGPAPAIVYVCGHAYSPYGDKTQYQRHGISLARNGYVAMLLDSIQIAETFGLHHGVRSLELFDWYARGYTPAGVEVWNAMRAIDYLETRPEVDRERIGMTGRSGGAAMSWFTAAVDPRIKVVVPVMGISTYAANLRENTQRLHCDCMFAINSWQHDMLHQGALIAPRPLLMAHGRRDRLFPVAGYEEFQARIGALYRAYGHPDDFANIVVDTAHQDSDYLREQAICWFDRFLKKIPQRKLEMDYSNAPEESLAVFAGKPPGDAQNFRIQETFTTHGRPAEYSSLAQWEARRKELLELLRTRVFAAMLHPLVPPPAPRLGPLHRPKTATGALPGVLYIASDGEDRTAIGDLMAGTGTSVWQAVFPRGVSETPWDKTFWKDTLRNAMHVGQTVDSLRLAEVLAAFESFRKESGVAPERITVMGKGISGALGLYAAILDDRIAQLLLLDPPATHAEGPIFLNILRYTDLPEAAALLAPRRLNFYARMPSAFEYTRRIYRLYRAPDHVFVTFSLHGAIEGRYDHNFASGT